MQDWPEPWYQVPESQRASIEQELRRELGEGHPLAAMAVSCLAKRDDRDDILMSLDDLSGRVAEVHLTWSGRHEFDPRWPRTRIFESIQEWRREADRS